MTLREPCDESFCYLTTVGRKSGRLHEIEIWFACAGPVRPTTLYMLSGARDRADWVRNLAANSAVRIRIRGQVLQGTARILQPDTSEDALARRLVLDKYRGVEGALDEWAATSLPVVVDLEWPDSIFL